MTVGSHRRIRLAVTGGACGYSHPLTVPPDDDIRKKEVTKKTNYLRSPTTLKLSEKKGKEKRGMRGKNPSDMPPF